MKILLFIFLFFSQIVSAQGKFAAEFSTIIGKKFITEQDLPELKGFKYRQGKVLGEILTNAPIFRLWKYLKKEILQS